MNSKTSIRPKQTHWRRGPALSRRGFGALLGGGAALAWSSALLARVPALAAAAPPRTPAQPPRVAIFQDMPYFDFTGQGAAYRPPAGHAGTRKYLAGLSREEFLRRHWFT